MFSKELTINAPRSAVEHKYSVATTTTAISGTLEPGNYVLLANTPVFVLVGSSPAATSSCVKLPANQAWRLAGIQNNEKVSLLGATAAGSAQLWKD